MSEDQIIAGVAEEPVVEKQEEKSQIDEYEQSAIFIKHYAKMFKKMGYDLANRKKRSPIRVLEALLFNPLEDVKLYGKAENDLLQLSSQILYHKGKLMEYAEKRKLEKQGETNEQK